MGLAHKLPATIQSNMTPPSIQVGGQSLNFFQDVALIEQGDHFWGAISYAEPQARGPIARFSQG